MIKTSRDHHYYQDSLDEEIVPQTPPVDPKGYKKINKNDLERIGEE
jgi:hypothetical protein